MSAPLLQIAALEGAPSACVCRATACRAWRRIPPDAAVVRSLIDHHRVVPLQGLLLDAPGQPGPSNLPEPAQQHIFVSARDAASIPPGPTAADAAHMWHADYSATTPVARLAMRYTLDMPPSGSCNGSMDMARVHAALPPALQQEIAALHACH